MTEDEAFIRAIVDSPGDDTPRLVYADWLDDRGDPRGAYLRAEREWAVPWQAGERPQDDPTLRALAVGLDLVWVARVSRPPVGVCCEHIPLVRGSPGLAAADVAAVEDRFRLSLPIEYRAFLLNYNGGAVDMDAVFGYPAGTFADGVRHAEFWPDQEWTFHQINDLKNHLALREEHSARPPVSESGVGEWYRHFVQIGRGLEAPDQILLGLAGPHSSRVLLDYNLGDAHERELYESTLALPDFLATLPNDYRCLPSRR